MRPQPARIERFRDYLLHFPDRTTQWLSEDPLLFCELAAPVLPPALLPRLDFRRAHLVPRTLLTRALDLREADVLYYVACRPLPDEPPGDYYVTVHLDQNAQPERHFRVREGGYRFQYWDRKLRHWDAVRQPEHHRRLPPFLSLLHHTGPHAWSGPDALRYAEPPILPDGMRRNTPHWGFHFRWIRDIAPAELLDRGTAGALALLAWREERSEWSVFQPTLADVCSGLERLPREERGRWQTVMEFIWALVTRRRPRAEYAESTEMIRASARRSRFWALDVQAMEEFAMETMADWWIAQGEQRGITIGEQRGITIGEQRGITIGEQRGITIGEQHGIGIGEQQAARDLLLRVLRARFRDVPLEAMEAIERAELTDVQHWITQAAVVDRFADTGIIANGHS